MLTKFIASGLPVLPVFNKLPVISSHKFLDDRLPTIEDYAGISGTDYALKTGNAQTKIECVDIDLKHMVTGKHELWTTFKDLIPAELMAKCVIETTPNGGFHLIYKADFVPGSQKLCYIEGIKEAIIETRGKGAYFVCYPSIGYSLVQGDIFDIQKLTEVEIDIVKTAARCLNERPPAPRKLNNTQRAYNATHSSLGTLEQAGWTVFKDKPDRFWLTRPGKPNGVSATLFKDSGFLYVFSSGTCFEPGNSYTPFDVDEKLLGKMPEAMEKETIRNDRYIFDVVSVIRKNEAKLKSFEMKETLATTIIEYMEIDGRFYKDDCFGYYFYSNSLIKIDLYSDCFYTVMYELCGAIKTEPDYKYVFERIKNHALLLGKKTEIHAYCHYNGCAVYVDNFNGKVFKISKEIEEINNGDDGILFLKSHNTPANPTQGQGSAEKFLFEGTTFKEPEKKMFYLWVLSIFFLKKNKPIVTIIGEPGSGKTFLFRKLLLLLFGNDQAIKLLPDKASDFWPMVTSNKLAVLDNVDTHRDWINDALASCATGGSVSVRKLYTTNDEAVMPLDCHIGITSANPTFTRSDIADRMLIFSVERQESFVSEDFLIKETLKARNVFLGSLFCEIKNCLSKMAKTVKPCLTRMADFETFAMRIGDNEELFLRLKIKQREFSSDTFDDLLATWVKENVNLGIVQKTAFEMSLELNKLAKDLGLKNFLLTSKRVGHKLNQSYDFCAIEKVSVGNRKTEYKIYGAKS